MNGRLIFQLSLFGLAMAIATVFWIPSKIEPICWLAIFITCTYFIARLCTGKYFLHGFLLSLVNCVYITAAHIILYAQYVESHPEETNMMSKMQLEMNPRLLMLITGPLIGIVSGLVLGLFAFIASRIVKRS